MKEFNACSKMFHKSDEIKNVANRLGFYVFAFTFLESLLIVFLDAGSVNKMGTEEIIVFSQLFGLAVAFGCFFTLGMRIVARMEVAELDDDRLVHRIGFGTRAISLSNVRSLIVTYRRDGRARSVRLRPYGAWGLRIELFQDLDALVECVVSRCSNATLTKKVSSNPYTHPYLVGITLATFISVNLIVAVGVLVAV